MPKTSEKVRFVCIDYNWGPPVSGRADKDFLQIWASVEFDVDPDIVSLVGKFNNEKPWNAFYTFDFVKEVDKTYKLYLLQVEGRLPVEFVIKLLCTNGSTYFDNNGGYDRNYKMCPFQGRFTSAHAGIDHIHIYSNFVHCSIVKKTK